MKKIAITASLLIVAGFLVAGSLVSGEMPGPDAVALWHYITEVSPYREWNFWPDHQGMLPGRAPHGPLHKVYVNEQALNSLKPPVEYGAIEVKDSYDKAEKLQAITVMYKIEGYNPQDGDWFWAKYAPDGKVKSSGKLAGCISCHRARAKNDFVTVHELR